MPEKPVKFTYIIQKNGVAVNFLPDLRVGVNFLCIYLTIGIGIVIMPQEKGSSRRELRGCVNILGVPLAQSEMTRL